MTLAESELTTHYLSVLIVPAIVTHCAPPPVQTNLNSALRLGVAPNQPQSTSGTRSILNYSRQTKEITYQHGNLVSTEYMYVQVH